jgi:flagellar export protein FliJ
MAGLKSIIRLRKQQLDDKRRAIAQLIGRMDNLKREEQREIDNLEAEKKLAAKDADGLRAFPNYNKRVQEKLTLLRDEMVKLEAAIQRGQAELQDAFKEYKTYEITDREREKRAAAAEKKSEDAAMDEIGIEGFRRKGK